MLLDISKVARISSFLSLIMPIGVPGRAVFKNSKLLKSCALVRRADDFEAKGV